MRHKVKCKRFGRPKGPLSLMFRNLMISLLQFERIETTLPKAKELRRRLEPIITKAKKDTLHNRRIVDSRIRNKTIVHKLFNKIAPANFDRPGGYVRILKKGYRSDSAPMALIELVDKT